MIRRDYLLRMVEKFAQILARIRELSAARQFADAEVILHDSFLELGAGGPEAVAKMTETELLSRLSINDPTHVLRAKVAMIATLLEEAAQLHARQGRADQVTVCRLKSLNLLLSLELRDADFELPDFVPNIDHLHAELAASEVPSQTLAALYRHYERIGAYARAEDTLFELLEADPGHAGIVAEIKALYERLLRHDDESLAAGNLPRPEIIASLAELRAKTAKAGPVA
jgi:hypothetical protein